MYKLYDVVMIIKYIFWLLLLPVILSMNVAKTNAGALDKANGESYKKIYIALKKIDLYLDQGVTYDRFYTLLISSRLQLESVDEKSKKGLLLFNIYESYSLLGKLWSIKGQKNYDLMNDKLMQLKGALAKFNISIKKTQKFNPNDPRLDKVKEFLGISSRKVKTEGVDRTGWDLLYFFTLENIWEERFGSFEDQLLGQINSAENKLRTVQKNLLHFYEDKNKRKTNEKQNKGKFHENMNNVEKVWIYDKFGGPLSGVIIDKNSIKNMGSYVKATYQVIYPPKNKRNIIGSELTALFDFKNMATKTLKCKIYFMDGTISNVEALEFSDVKEGGFTEKALNMISNISEYRNRIDFSGSCTVKIIGSPRLTSPKTGNRLYTVIYCEIKNNRLKMCGGFHPSLLATGDIEDFCRSKEQCDYIEDYAYNLLKEKGFLEAKSYFARLKKAWQSCDEKNTECKRLSQFFLKDHELN